MAELKVIDHVNDIYVSIGECNVLVSPLEE